jgi:hypothetical protein
MDQALSEDPSSDGWARAIEGKGAAWVTRRKRLRFNRGTHRCGAARFARVLRT